MLEDEDAAVEGAEKTIDCAVPGVSVRTAGVSVTPVGRPPTETLTVDENPPTADTSNDALSVLPALSEPLSGEIESVKSGFGGGVIGLLVPPPPPHPAKVNIRNIAKDTRMRGASE
jgi:hypothetical protein